LLERLYSLNASANSVSPNGFYQNLYNRTRAVNYADVYTSKAPWDKSITCWIDGKPVVSRYTDLSYWNNSQYPLTKYSNGYYERLAM